MADENFNSKVPFDLLGLVIPPKHRPGTDLMSKAILKDQRVINMVVSNLVGQHAVGNYKPQSGEWLDGKRVDILLIPITTITESLPPVVIEIQNVVDKVYIHRLNQYCSNIYEEYCNIEPVVLTICIKSTRAELCKRFSCSSKAPYLKRLPSDFWAKEHLIITPTTVTDYLDTHSNHNDQIPTTQIPTTQIALT